MVRIGIFVSCLVGFYLSSGQTLRPGIVWSTYYSGSTPGLSEGNDVAVDAEGNVYIAGTTSDDELAYRGYDMTLSGGRDGYLVKFNPKGQRIWATYYGGGAYDDVGESVAIDNYGNVYFSGMLNNTATFLVKFTSSGELIWSKTYSGNGRIWVNDIAADKDGNVFITGRTTGTTGIALNGHDNMLGLAGTFTGKTDGFLLKINQDGQTEWGTYCGGSEDDEATSVITDHDDNVYIIGTTKSTTAIAFGNLDNTYGSPFSDAFIVKYSTSGAGIWGTYFGGTGEDMGTALTLDTQGDFFYAGGRTLSSADLAFNGFDNTVGFYDAWLGKFTLDGQRVWSTYYGSPASNVVYDQCEALATDDVGNVYMAGTTKSSTDIAYNGFDNMLNGAFDAFLAKFSGSGDRLWGTYFGGDGDDNSRSVATDKKGMVYMTGRAMSPGLSYHGFDNSYAPGNMDSYLIKITDASIDKPSFITGYVYEDKDKDCIKDPEDRSLPNVTIRTEPVAYFAITDANGFYSIAIDTGHYTVRQLTSSAEELILKQVCPPELTHNIHVVNPGDTLTDISFGNEVKLCHHLETQVTSSQRRRCVRSNTVINYRNTGLADAQEVKVFVELPEYVTLVSANASYTEAGKNIYVFEVGQLTAGASGSIMLIDSVLCGNPGIRGLTQCTRVWATPGNNCFAPKLTWDKSDLAVSAICLQDGRAKLVIRNQGDGDMADSTYFRIFFDAEMVLFKKIRLSQFDSLVLRVSPNGKNIYFQADQTRDHPTKKSTSISLEGCGTSTDIISLGFVESFPLDDPQPEVDTECLPIVDSFDPNDKKVSPLGIGEDHYVPTQTRLEFAIRFQNTGNASAIDITISDTLDLNLDISTIRFEGGSHSYQALVEGKDAPVLIWNFRGINLPDSIANEPLSHGFVKFSILPKSNLPEKTIIQNAADIQFDFNEPIKTNFTTSNLYDIPWKIEEGNSLDPTSVIILKPIIQELITDDSNDKALNISGLHFSSVLSENSVTVNGESVQLISGSATELSVLVQNSLTSGTVRVTNLAGWDERSLTITGTESETLNLMNIYPNPSQGRFTVEFTPEVNSVSNVRLLNVLGESLPISYTFKGRFQMEVQTHEHQTGFYFIMLETNKGVITKKLVFGQ